MNYLSVCSGVEAATVAWHGLGWNPLAFSEIEKFPSEVLAHHYPAVPNLGDMTKYKEWNFGTDRLDLLVGGTPCQSFSVAGLRKGLDDPRGNLALVYCGILDKFRPKWFVWENVPGVLSSSGGRDFGAFLGALVELGYGFSYRVLDAQYFGVAQRRRRVFVVGSARDWRDTAKVLFESDCLRGDTKKSRGKREAVARGFVPSVASCLQTTCNDYSRADGFNMIAYENHASDSRIEEISVFPTIRARWGTGGGNVPLIQSIGFTQCDAARDAGDNISPTLRSGGDGGYPAHSVAYGFEPGIAKREGNPNRFNEEISPTLRAEMGDNQVATAFVWDTTNITSPFNGSNPKSNDPCHTLAKGQHPPLLTGMAVRRLTPVECERLQGFPDDYTNIKEKCPDGPRYKAMGNSMAVPVMRWIGKRIQMVEDGLL